MKSSQTIVAVLLALGAAVPICACRPQESASGKVLAVAAIPPQAYFVERIGGARVDAQVLVGPGQSPHTYEPTPAQVAGIARASVYFRIGLPFEEQLLQRFAATAPNLRIVDTLEGVPLRHMTADEASADSDEHEAAHEEHDHEHAAGRPDPHTWLSPRLAAIEAANICDGLAAVDPAHADDYRANLEAVRMDLDALDRRLAAALAPLKGRSLFVYHPAFGYFADAYGLKQVPVEAEGKSPSARQLAALIRRAKEQGAKVIFVQPQFAPASAQAVARAIGGAVVPLDPLARDYVRNLQDMAGKVESALGPAAPAPGGIQ
jgi:zinc transport system substrate-binding protein